MFLVDVMFLSFRHKIVIICELDWVANDWGFQYPFSHSITCFIRAFFSVSSSHSIIVDLFVEQKGMIARDIHLSRGRRELELGERGTYWRDQVFLIIVSFSFTIIKIYLHFPPLYLVNVNVLSCFLNILDNMNLN